MPRKINGCGDPNMNENIEHVFEKKLAIIPNLHRGQAREGLARSDILDLSQKRKNGEIVSF